MITVRAATVAEILPLRHSVLRPGLPVAAAQFDGDHEATTRHFAALLPDGALVCCASFMTRPWQDAPAYQLRGMATRPDLARQGLGTRLLDFALGVIVAASGPRLVWCNARLPAVAFYRRLGWTIASPAFDIPGVGPHHAMVCRLLP